MAATRASIKCLSRHLRHDASVLKSLLFSRCLVSLATSHSKLTELWANSTGDVSLRCNSANVLTRSGGRILRRALVEGRNFRTSAQDSQLSQLEADIAASDPAPGFRAVPLPLRNYSPALSGFSVLPNPAAVVSAGLSSPSGVGNVSLEQLGREMSNCLSQGRLEETVQLYEDWMKFPDIQGKSKVPSVMVYNLLLHAKLRLGVDPRNMLQVIKDMEMCHVKPNLLSYNFLLRAIFRQRDSKMAEKILDKMVQSGEDVQPDGDSYNFVIVLCALDRRLDAAMVRLKAMLERGYVPSKTTYNELLVAATRLHRSRVAVHIMKDIKKRNIVPQLQTVLELAIAAAEVDDSECALLALRFFSDTELSKSVRNLTMDEGGLYYLLSSAARATETSLSNEAWALLRSSLRETRPPSPASYLARIHALSSAGDFSTACSTLREFEAVFGDPQTGADREIFSPFSSLRPLVLACTRGGFAALDAAYFKLAEMQAAGEQVPLSAVNCVIQGCANAWDFDRAYQTFETIGTTFGLMPDVHSCNSLLDVFGKTRKTAEVLQIFSYMDEVGVIPDERSYSLLIEAHVVNRDPKAALDALEAMKTAGHVPQRETYHKVWRRCRKEGDDGGAAQIAFQLKQIGYRGIELNAGRWEQIAAV